ncbi:hypothetical protein DPMN_091873 [Dreissena polymorpha]|uniref:Uncharacterized protein n=1 Tax=Dreissena polymorpha TaxID=45954 RepID=A0A9D4L0A4_DREPO|nr:hypothetical protein DPMN_091873 [Dreissena polymorpha]
MATSVNVFTDKKTNKWLKAYIALKLTKNSLAAFVETEIQKIHQSVGKTWKNEFIESEMKCQTDDNFTDTTACYIINTSTPVDLPIQSPENVNDQGRNNIIKLHRQYLPSWANIDDEAWPPIDAWQLAKCFLPLGGCNGITSFQELDLSDLISIMQNCVHFDMCFSLQNSAILAGPHPLFTKVFF